jgi:hypothetical protein
MKQTDVWIIKKKTFFTGESPSLLKWSWNSTSASTGDNSSNDGGGGCNNIKKKIWNISFMYHINPYPANVENRVSS